MDNKKKMGRPTCNPKINQLRIRLSDDEKKILDECCKKTGLNKSEVIIKGIELVYKS